MKRRIPLANESRYLFKTQLGYIEQPISRIEVAVAIIVWYISSYVILTFPESYHRHGFIIFSVAILFVMIQWRYFFTLLIYLSLYVPLFQMVGMIFFLLPLLIIPALANSENYLIRIARWNEERNQVSIFDYHNEDNLIPYLSEI